MDPSQAAGAVTSSDTEIWLTVITLLVGVIGVLITVVATLLVRSMNNGFATLGRALETHVADDEKLKGRVGVLAQRVTKLDGGVEII